MGMLGGKGETKRAAEPTGLSVISIGTTVRGDVESTGTVKVEGAVEGNVRARQQVLVAREGTVRGDVEATEAVIGGTVHGAIRCQERVEVQSGASIHGDLSTRRIMVAEGATVNGMIRMGDAALGSRSEVRGGQALPGIASTVGPSNPVATPPHSSSSNY